MGHPSASVCPIDSLAKHDSLYLKIDLYNTTSSIIHPSRYWSIPEYRQLELEQHSATIPTLTSHAIRTEVNSHPNYIYTITELSETLSTKSKYVVVLVEIATCRTGTCSALDEISSNVTGRVSAVQHLNVYAIMESSETLST